MSNFEVNIISITLILFGEKIWTEKNAFDQFVI